MGLVGDLRVKRSMLKEARDRYVHEANRDLTRWDHESSEHFQQRKDKHHKRVRHFRKHKNSLKAKVKTLAKKVKKQKQASVYDKKGGEIVTFDGKPVVEWLAYWLQKSREHGWNGVLVSGYRTPEYSQQLCYNMCGAPSCPGKCAGTSSNHTRKGYLQGACDVSDYTNFEAIQFQIGSPLKNDLPVDPVHFSASGH